METDRLKTLWQQRDTAPTRDAGPDVGRIAKRVDLMRRQVRRRDYFEHAAAIFCVVFFARLVFVLPSTVARVAAALLAACALLAIVKLIRARPRRRQTDTAVTVRQFCEDELRRVESQIRLLKTVPLWSVGPVLAGVNVMVAALSPRLLWTISYLVATLVLGTWVCYLNLKAVRNDLVPLRNDLLRVLREAS